VEAEKKTPTPLLKEDVQAGVFGGYDPGSGGGVLIGNLALTFPHLNPAYHLNEEGGSDDFWGSGRVGFNVLSGLGPVFQYQGILGAPTPSPTSAPLYRSQTSFGLGINVFDLQIRRKTIGADGKPDFDAALLDIQGQAQYFHQFLTDPVGGPTSTPSAREADQIGLGLNLDFHLTRHLSIWGQFGGQWSSFGGWGPSPVLLGIGLHSEEQ
jgi:hypothetical protein